MLTAIGRALHMAALMGWKMLWALVLGFAVSGVIQALVSKREMARLLPDDHAATIAKATALGAASSSCSYAAVAIARAVVRKGGDFTAAMAFQFASTNLVLELGLVLWVLLGWRFTLGTWVGGIVMIAFLAVLMRLFVSGRTKEEAKAQADRGVSGRMEGHAEMDMAVEDGPLLKRLVSAKGFTAVSHFFIMDWASLWLDLLIGLLVSGALAAWVPAEVWGRLFFAHDPFWSRVAGPLIGPLVAVVTFVCSVGNVPLAAVLWRGGAGFGGVIGFLFGDLIVLPVLDIYRRYYGLKAAALLFGLFYAAMAAAALVVEFAFGALHLAPAPPRAHGGAAMEMGGFAWDYTTWLDLLALALGAVLLWRFLRTGGPKMLAEMAGPGSCGHAHGGHEHHAHPHDAARM